MTRHLTAAFAVLTLIPGALIAQDGEAAVALELNAVQATETGCTFSFLITNNTAETIDAMVLEAVLFDSGGQVDRLTLFDFGRLPAARPRVRQFVVPGSDCSGFGSVLINGAQTCDVAATASTLCEDALRPTSRADIALIG